MSIMRSQRKKKDLPITGGMAKWYDKNTKESRLKEMQNYAELVASSLAPGGKVLEIAPGPGYLSIALAKKGYKVTGVELSSDFVAIEKQNAKKENVECDFREGNASDLPLEGAQFDFTVCSAAFKNFKEPLKAINEMHRVLKPGGVALILDMNRNHTKEDVEKEMESSNMKGFDRWFVKLSFETFLKKGAYSIDEFNEFIKQSKFEKSKIEKNGIGLKVWLYKQE